MLSLREYQRESIEAIYRYFARKDGNPLIVLPTGAGKSLVIAQFCKEVLEQWPGQRIIILTHVKELIAQNYAELVGLWPEAPAGIYSAGLGKRQAQAQILFAGIQSVCDKVGQLQWADLIMIDEAHLVPRKASTMYRRFISAFEAINPKLKIIGLTATHYRLDSGMLHTGPDAMFTDIAHETNVRDLVEQGYLAPLVSKRTDIQLDTSGVGKKGGEFIASQLERAVDVDEITRAAVDEIVDWGEDRRSWIVFGSGVSHCEHICAEIQSRGYSAACIFGETPAGERDALIRAFKAFELRCLVSRMVLTTGFNAPAVDLIADLAPTESTGLHVQKYGRGMRLYTGKSNCLVLDFAGNVRRHGPIDCVAVKDKSASEGGDAPVKSCPECKSQVRIAATECPDCGFEFPLPEITSKLAPKASVLPVMTDGKPEWLDVTEVRYFRHEKPGKPPSMRAEYRCGFVIHKEWVCIEHTGRARVNAVRWWQARSSGPVPTKTDAALSLAPHLKKPARIAVRRIGKYTEVVDVEFVPDLPSAPRQGLGSDRLSKAPWRAGQPESVLKAMPGGAHAAA